MILPDPDQMNQRRIERADQALLLYCGISNDEPEDAVCDLLADLMHWCDSKDMDFDEELRKANSHHHAETSEETEPIE